jgi:hypothetical protein
LRFAASLDLYATDPLDLLVPDLVDLIHPLAPDLIASGNLLRVDGHDGAYND